MARSLPHPNHLAVVFPVALLCSCSASGSAHAKVTTRALFDFSLRGEVAGGDLTSRFQVEDSGRLSTLNMQLRGDRYSGEAGDLAADWDELSFSSRTFRGLRFGSKFGKGEASLLGGAVESTNLAGRNQLSTVFGVRGSYPLTSQLQLRAAQLWSAGAVNDPVTSVGLQFKPGLHDTLALEMARSRDGIGWQLGASHRTRKLEIQGRYRQVSDGFSSAGNPLLQTERSGHATQIIYRPSRTLSFSAASRRFTNAWDEKDRAERASVQFSKPGLPSVNLYWQHRDERQLPSSFFRGLGDDLLGDPDQDIPISEWSRSDSRTMGVQLTKDFSGTNVSLGLEQLLLNQEASGVVDRRSQRISLALARTLGSRTSVQLFHSRELAVEANREGQDKGEFTQISVFHRLNQRGLGLRLGLQQQSGFYSQLSGKSLTGQVGLVLPVARNTAVELDWRSNLKGSGYMQSNSADVLQIRFRQAIQFGGKRQSKKTKQQRQTLAGIRGRVFEDLNLNGRWDNGEPPVHEVSVALNRNTPQTADAQGRYQFADLTPRVYKVGVVVKTLPIEFTMLTLPETQVTTVAGQNTEIDFPAVRTGRISGSVYLDENRNGQQDEGEKPAVNIVVKAENSEAIGITDESGRFLLDSLPPGKWNVTADVALAGPGMEVASPIETTVKPNAETRDVVLAVRIKEKGVIHGFKKNQE